LNNLYNPSSKSITHPDIPDWKNTVFKLSATNGYLNKYTARSGENFIFTSTDNKEGIVKASIGNASYSIKIINLKIDAPDVNKYYNASERFIVTLTDSSHKPVPNTNVSITIDGETTSGLSDSNGQFSIPLNLNPGSYIVTTTVNGLKVLSNVNINSTIKSSDVSGIYNNVHFEATILDSTGKPVYNREVKFKIDNLVFTDISDVNGVAGVDINLDTGKYTITTINPVTGEVKTNNVDISKTNSSTYISSKTFAHGVTLTANINPSNLSGEAVFIINGYMNYTEKVVNSKASITLNLDVGYYTAKVTFNGTSNYKESSSNIITFHVDEQDLVISAPDVIKDYGGLERFNVTLTMNNVPVANVDVKISLNNVNYTKSTDEKGKISLNIDDLDAGIYSVVTSYSSAIANSVIIVYPLTTTTSLSYVNNSYNSVTLNAIVNPSSAIGEVVFTVNGNDYTVKISDGKATYKLSDLVAGSYTAKAVYKGETNYKSSTSNIINFTVNPKPKENLTIEATAEPITVGEDANVIVTGLKDATGNVTVIVNGKTYAAPIKNTEATVIIPGLTENVTANVNYAGDDKYNPASTTVKITVNPKPKENLTISATADPIIVGDNATVIVTGLKDATGNVTVTIGSNKWTGKINKGTANIVVTGLKENVTANVNYAGDDKYNPTSTTVKITVNPNVIIYAPDVTKYYGGSERFAVTLKDLDGNPIANANIKITINGQTYTKTTDKNGETSIAINLNSGVYNVTTEYNGTKVYSTITVKDTVIAKDVTKIFRNGTQYQGTFVDSKGNLVKNTDVRININGVFYTRTTDANGMAQLNINLPPGTYILTATNPVTGEQHTTTVTVLPNIVENYDLTKYYKNASQYSLRLLDDKGNPVGAGVSIQLNINGILYTRTSDANGYVKMNINLPPGTYIITAEYKGLRMSNTIKVLTVLEANDLVMRYHDGSQFKAKVLDGQGRPYAGQTVTYNINGVFYTKISGDDGIAGLTINLPAGEYIITSMYNALNAANKITIIG
jgi:hypothetical protein